MLSHRSRAILASTLVCAGCRSKASSESRETDAQATVTTASDAMAEAADASAAPEPFIDAGPSIIESDGGACARTSTVPLRFGERTRVERDVRYRVAGSQVWVCLVWSGYPLVRRQAGGHRHMLAARFEAGSGNDGSLYVLTGPEYFVVQQLEVRYEADGPLRYTSSIDIAITVTPRPGGPITL